MTIATEATHDLMPSRLIIGGERFGPVLVYCDDHAFRAKIATPPPPGGTLYLRAPDSEQPEGAGKSEVFTATTKEQIASLDRHTNALNRTSSRYGRLWVILSLGLCAAFAAGVL